MSINENPIEIRLTPRFQKDLKILAKRYRSIRQDVQPLLQIYSSNCRTKKIVEQIEECYQKTQKLETIY